MDQTSWYMIATLAGIGSFIFNKYVSYNYTITPIVIPYFVKRLYYM